MFNTFTGGALATIGSAMSSARELGHPELGPEHLLLGASRNPSILNFALRAVVIYPERLREAIASVREAKCITQFDTPFEPRTKRLFRAARDLADRMKHEKVNTGHLFLAMLDDEEIRCFLAELLSTVSPDDLLEGMCNYIQANLELGIEEYSPTTGIQKDELAAKLVQWARQSPDWRTDLRLIMEAAGISALDIEEQLIQ